MQAFTRLR